MYVPVLVVVAEEDEVARNKENPSKFLFVKEIYLSTLKEIISQTD